MAQAGPQQRVSSRRWAAALGTAPPKTVSNQVASILAELRLSDPTQAAVAAREAGLGGGGGARRSSSEG